MKKEVYIIGVGMIPIKKDAGTYEAMCEGADP